MAERDFSEIARLSERFSKDPTSRIFVQLADAYRKNKMIDEAIDVLNQGLEHHPDYPLAHLIRGKCLFDSRNYNQARESFEKTISLDPQNVVAYRMLAQTCAFLKDNEGLIAAYKGILALDPFDTTVKEKLADLVSEERNEPMYTVSMAQEYEQRGDMKKALEIYERLLYTDPSDLLLQQKVKALKGSLEEDTSTEPPTAPTYKSEDTTRETDIPPSEMEIQKPPPEQPSDVVTHEPTQEHQVFSLEDILSGKNQEPKIQEPTVQEPETQEPTVQEPETQEPTAQEPRTEELETQEPTVQEPETQEPVVQEPESREPTVPDQEHLPEEIMDSEEISKLITTPQDENPFDKPETPEQPGDIIIEQTGTVEPSPPETPEQETLISPEPAYEQTPQPEQKETPAQDSENLEDISPPSEETPSSEEPPPEPPQKPEKPKEEDFQSFKDWLSGLIK